MMIATSAWFANKFSVPKYVCYIILTIAAVTVFNTYSYSQTTENKRPPFNLSSLTSTYSNSYLHSIFDNRITDPVQIVALGEVSHGGYESMAFNANMVRYLIESKGYRKVLFERSDIGVIRAMRNYLNDQHTNDTAYITKWIKDAQFVDAASLVYLNLFKWIKQYNDKHPKDIVEVMGFEISKEQSVINFILNKYVIPYNYEQSQQYVYQLNSDISDAEKIEVLNKWFTLNEMALKAKLKKEDFYWLHFYIHNAVNGLNFLSKKSKSESERSNTANLFRDSVMAENVRYLGNDDKAIVWAHNAHVIRTEIKCMGDHLNQYLKNRYYVIATDFSKLAAVDVTNKDSTENANKKYVTKIFKSSPSTTAYQILDKYGISEGIFFRQDLVNMAIAEDTNIIDANGLHFYIPGSHNTFDALVIFSNIHPTAK